MASSSQAQQPLPYEVFINFRGEDTRNIFVCHLDSALKRKSIRTYFDEENLEKGQTIGDELKKAIKESNTAIVVLSENYGSSTWCLDELVEIMECEKRSGLIVFPIFYHVEPSVVRKQKDKFSEAFSRYEVDFRQEGEKVKSWREALRQVSNLAGEHIHQQNEASCVEDIATKIFNRLPVKVLTFRKSCVGIESRISEIKKLMDSKPDEVLFIGLWGMGGVGKTTMARAIFDDCKKAFEGSCFLGDVKEKDKEIHILQKDLLEAVLKEDLKGINDKYTGANMIEERLQSKKVLLIIDDVNNAEQLNALANHIDWFGKGSRIIITTRDEHVINKVHIQKFQVHILPKEEALHLFSLCAFNKHHPDEDFIDLSLEVLSYAQGLPLALSVLGKYLHLKRKNIWEDVLKRLVKHGPRKDIMNVLLISFDGLEDAEKDIFLDIACFFRGDTKEEVEERLESLGLSSKEGINRLCQMSLIYLIVDEFSKQLVIEMHDLLQEMGWYINRKERDRNSLKDDLTKYNRLWLEDDLKKIFSSSITEPCEVERLITSMNPDDSMKPSLGWEVTFRNMSKLSFLDLRGDFFKGNYDANVTQPFGKSGNNLRWFSWYKYPGQSLPKGSYLVNLVQLRMSYSMIEETPDFSQMTYLEVVDLSYSIMLVSVHPSLGTRKKIKRINLSYCESLKEFPSIDSLKSLEFMDLSYTKIQNFPEICGNLDSLRKLELKQTPINGLPKSILGNASCLEKLEFDCELGYNEDFIRSLDIVAKSFPGLVSIVITRSGIISTLDFSQLPNLEKLNLSYSKELVQVDASLGKHKRIKSIDLTRCSKLEDFPPIDNMESLEELRLRRTSLKFFPEMSGNVKRLWKLELDETHITTLPWSIGCATSLQYVSMINCDYLFQLPVTILGLQRKVIIIGSSLLKGFTGNIDDGVDFSRAKGLQQSIGRLSRSNICFTNCGSLKELPEYLLSRIEVLQVEDCRRLMIWICENLVGLLVKYQHLRILRLHPRKRFYINIYGGDDGGRSNHKFLQALWEWEPVCNMLQKRNKPLVVCGPGTELPSWFQYQFSNSSNVTMYLPPSSRWYTDKLRGFVLGYISYGDDSINNDANIDECCQLENQMHLFVRYIPIADISEFIDSRNECSLFEQSAKITRFGDKPSSSTPPRMGLSFVYSEGEVNQAPPHQVTYAQGDDYYRDFPCSMLFRVMIKEE